MKDLVGKVGRNGAFLRPFFLSAGAKLGKRDGKSKKKCGFISEYHELHDFL